MIDKATGQPLPDPEKPITFDSFVEQYEEWARKLCRAQGVDENLWRVRAEVVAQIDIETLQIMTTVEPNKTPKELLEQLLLPIPSQEENHS